MIISLSLAELVHRLTHGTVLGEWYWPMTDALRKVRFSDKQFTAMPMSAFVLLGCLRQLQHIGTLREQVQHVFHLNDEADKPPLARSTYSHALASRTRLDIVHHAVEHLVDQAQQQ